MWVSVVIHLLKEISGVVAFSGLVKIRMSEYYSKTEDVDIDSILEGMSYHEKLPVSEKHETCF